MEFRDNRWQDYAVTPLRTVDVITALVAIVVVFAAYLAGVPSRDDAGAETSIAEPVHEAFHEPWPNDPPATRGSELATAVHRRPMPSYTGG